MDITLNKQSEAALHALEYGRGVLVILGPAGTGKSTLLDYFRLHTQRKSVVVAPTGIAAVNVMGETIHSFFKFKPDVTVKEAKELGRRAGAKRVQFFQSLDLLIIDEISMVRADLLDCIDTYLRQLLEPALPFGGMHVACIGDVYQLPPIVTRGESEFWESYKTPYFFSSKVMEEVLGGAYPFALEELTQVYRQEDGEFRELLHRVRRRRNSTEDFHRLKGRVAEPESEHVLHITATNKQADARNKHCLEMLPGEEVVFYADTSGDLDVRRFPSPDELILKKGARVMLTNNHMEGKWVNGSLGKILSIDQEFELVEVELENGRKVKVEPHTWEIHRTVLDDDDGKIKREVVGSYSQLPIRLAWAVTVHKSQGKTFERAHVDLGRGAFAHGQAYVALSRVTSLEGLTLARPLRDQEILMDERLDSWVNRMRMVHARSVLSEEEKEKRIRKAVEKGKPMTFDYLCSPYDLISFKVQPLSIKKQKNSSGTFVALRAKDTRSGKSETFNLSRILLDR